jgi:adenylate cyclase
LTNVKLLFTFCRDAHCFSDIYAKIHTVEMDGGQPVHALRVTYMNPADKDLLRQWLGTVGGTADEAAPS